MYGLNMEEDVLEYYVMNNKGKKYIDNFEIIEFNTDRNIVILQIRNMKNTNIDKVTFR